MKFLWVLETTKELVNDDYSNNQYMIEDSNSKISLSQKKKKKNKDFKYDLIRKKKKRDARTLV